MNRTFKVVTGLSLEDIPKAFTVTGALNQRAKTRHTSLIAATEEALIANSHGWVAGIYRRVPGGWTEVCVYEPSSDDTEEDQWYWDASAASLADEFKQYEAAQ
jgi:hypothetical protein